MRIEYLSFSIFLAGLLSLLRFKRIGKEYRPFLYLVWLACINESVSAILRGSGTEFYWNNNLYSLCESLLYLWLFRKTGILRRRKLCWALGISYLTAWIINNYFASGEANPYNSYFNLYYGFIIILLCVQSINTLLLSERAVMAHPLFLIAVGAILFFTFSVIIEVFWMYGFGLNQGFTGRVFQILMWVNFVTNLFFAAAITKMKRQMPVSSPF